jgi:hypothetical protein
MTQRNNQVSSGLQSSTNGGQFAHANKDASASEGALVTDAQPLLSQDGRQLSGQVDLYEIGDRFLSLDEANRHQVGYNEDALAETLAPTLSETLCTDDDEFGDGQGNVYGELGDGPWSSGGSSGEVWAIPEWSGESTDPDSIIAVTDGDIPRSSRLHGIARTETGMEFLEKKYSCEVLAWTMDDEVISVELGAKVPYPATEQRAGGVRLPAIGCRLQIVFELHGWDVADGGAQAHPVVSGLEPSRHSVLGLSPGGEDPAVIELALERAPEGLGHGVIPAHPGTSHGLGNTEFLTDHPHFVRGVLGSPVSMEN